MKNISSLPDILTVKDVQNFLNLSQTTAYRLFKSEDFPSFSVRSSKRVTKEDFLNWLTQQKQAK